MQCPWLYPAQNPLSFEVGDRRCTCNMCANYNVRCDEEPCKSCIPGISRTGFYGCHAIGFEPAKDGIVEELGTRFHELKTLPRYFHARDKNFEIRRDDRGFETGDILVLREWDGTDYTGAYTVHRITYILRNASEYGLMSGFCILGLCPMEYL